MDTQLLTYGSPAGNEIIFPEADIPTVTELIYICGRTNSRHDFGRLFSHFA